MQPTLSAYGTWSGGRFMHYGEKLDEARFVESIQYAYSQGIRTFVTADVYGNGESDTLLGQALKDFPRDSYCLVGAIGHDFYKGERVGNKGFPRFTNPALRGEAEYQSYLREATEKALNRLGTSHFDLIFLHNPDLRGYRSPMVWEGLKALKNDGLIKLLGIAPGPANGFVLDLLGAMEDYGDLIDWLMVILSPFEPWPAKFYLKAAEQFNVKIMTRVVDFGGIFYDDVKPGHVFAKMDHRSYRPAGWVEQGVEKLEKIRPIAEKHGLTIFQLAAAWNLSHPAVQSVVPTLIQEIGENARPMKSKIDELASLEKLPIKTILSPEEVAAMAAIGDNSGCMELKGGNAHFSDEVADSWPLDEKLIGIAQRWGINPVKDLGYHHG